PSRHAGTSTTPVRCSWTTRRTTDGRSAQAASGCLTGGPAVCRAPCPLRGCPSPKTRPVPRGIMPQPRPLHGARGPAHVGATTGGFVPTPMWRRRGLLYTLLYRSLDEEFGTRGAHANRSG